MSTELLKRLNYSGSSYRLIQRRRNEEQSNETGITIAGSAPDKDGNHHGYMLDDWTIKGSPDEWGRRAVAAYRRFEADAIVAEVNQGGDMVEHVIKTNRSRHQGYPGSRDPRQVCESGAC